MDYVGPCWEYYREYSERYPNLAAMIQGPGCRLNKAEHQVEKNMNGHGVESKEFKLSYHDVNMSYMMCCAENHNLI